MSSIYQITIKCYQRKKMLIVFWGERGLINLYFEHCCLNCRDSQIFVNLLKIIMMTNQVWRFRKCYGKDTLKQTGCWMVILSHLNNHLDCGYSIGVHFSCSHFSWQLHFLHSSATQTDKYLMCNAIAIKFSKAFFIWIPAGTESQLRLHHPCQSSIIDMLSLRWRCWI